MSNQNSGQWQAGDTILDLYRVIGILYQDEFGEVYRARHLGWNIDLSIHRLKPRAIAAIGGIEALKQTADAWVGLGLHPHVANAYYLRWVNEPSGEQPLMFTEFGSDGTLHQWIQNWRLYEQSALLRRILDIAIQLAWGLQTLHDQGLIHQNLTPATVLMAGDGIAKITQVGLAEAPPGYQSPEQINQTGLTSQTDLWGWGLTLLEMFTGKPIGSSGLGAVQVLDRYLEGMTSGIPRMPAPVAELLRRCFQNAPDLRPGSLREVANQMQAIYQTVTGTLYPRQEPSPLRSADSYNNWALALVDLDQGAEALQRWDEALTLQPQHLNSIYNRGIMLWRSGKISDRDLLNQLEANRPSPEDGHSKYFLGLVHWERGDYDTALRLLEEVQAQGIHTDTLSPLLAQLREKCPQAKQLLPEFRDRVMEYQQGTSRWVSSIALSPTGLYAVSGGSDRLIRIWEVPSGRCVCTFRRHRGQVTAVSLNSDGSQLLSGSEDQTIKLWNIASNSLQFTFGGVERVRFRDKIRRLLNPSPPTSSSNGHKGTIRAIAFSPDRRNILSGADDSALKLWDVNSGRCLQTLRGHRARVFAVAFDPTGREAISASNDQTIKLWNLTTGQVLQTLKGHQQLTAIALSSSGRYVLAGDTSIKLWDLSTGQVVRTFDDPGVQAIAFSPNERYLLSGSQDGRLRIWEVESGRCLRTFEPHESEIYAIALSSDGRYALSTDRDSLKLWAVHLNAPADFAPLSLSQMLPAAVVLTGDRRYEEEITQAESALKRGDAPAAAQHLRAARSGYPRGIEAVQAWLKLYFDLPRQSLREIWEQTTLDGHTASVRAVAFQPNGQSILSSSVNRTLKRWDVETERCLLNFEGHQSIAEAIALSSDGTQMLSGNADGTVTLWDVNSGERLRTLTGHQGTVRAVAFHPQGRYAVSGSDDRTVRLWDTATGRCLRTLTYHTDRVTAVAVSADGQSLLSGGADKTVVLAELATGEVLRTLEGHRAIVSSVAIGPDGRMALSGSDDWTLKLWNLATGDCVRTLSGHIEAVKSVAFSPDGRFAASGSDDRTVKLWNLATGDAVQTLTGHTERVQSVTFSPDSRFVASGSDDRTIKLWLLDWELNNRSPADWDEGASPYLDIFLRLHTPPRATLPDLREPSPEDVRQALTPYGTPAWGEADFNQLMRLLQQVGYGWLRPEGVREQLTSRTRSATVSASPAALPGALPGAIPESLRRAVASPDSTAFATAFATEFATSLGTTFTELETTAKVILTVTEGVLKGQKFSFRDRTVCIVGRAKDCHLPLPNDENHKTVSRYHCLLDINPPSVSIRDLGSLHGTYVNGQIIGRRNPDQSPEEGMQIRSSGHHLRQGDEIKLGKTVFKVAIEGVNPIAAANRAVFHETGVGQTAILDQKTVSDRSALNHLGHSSSAAPLPEIAGYKILHRLDASEVGTVSRHPDHVSIYEAQQLQTDKAVTLKLFQPEKTVPLSAIDTFLRSVNALKSLQHPNLLRLQEIGIASEAFFFAYDSFEGKSVADRVRQQGKLLPREAIEIVLQALEGLTYAHQATFPDQSPDQPQSRIHGRLTPSNLLLTPDQGVKISDYGIATAIAQAGLGDFSAANAAAFMPRQQAIDFKATQPELDLWAIAACLYYMLTGTFPRDFKGEDPYLVLLQTSPVPIRQREAGIPKALAELIDLALVDNPAIYFKNAAVFQQAIASVSID
ncbi:protein kinase [Leptolyngbya sp. GB1-A1]|uniref:WD40 domain-containing protein n=1 Tax=Leptolyngbya sp. GB1-A1 TaxID=2933908 RepID=UPI003297119B